MGSFQRARAGEGPISVEEAQKRVLDGVTALGPVEVPLVEAHGRVLGEDIVAPADVPETDNSAMDGYAVRAADVAGATDRTPVTLPVVADIAADGDASVILQQGLAARIMTGGPIPPGADSVVQVEWTDAGRDKVSILRPVSAGANVRRRGEDMRAGEVVLPAGLPIGAGETGVLATVRKTAVRVGRKPSVAILSTGDEIVSGRVANSNSLALAALARDTGCQVRVLPAVGDDREETERALRSALQCDVVITSGGVSQGAYDFVKDALEGIGAETRFWQVAMKPGKPIVFSRVAERPVFGLPGNPVSCLVCFLLFVRPALRKMMGQTANLFLPEVQARAASPFHARGDRRTYFRVQVVAGGGTLTAYPAAAQGSGVSTSMIGANGLGRLEAGVTVVGTGSSLPVLLFAPILSAQWLSKRSGQTT